jgi:hypothetical protein
VIVLLCRGYYMPWYLLSQFRPLCNRRPFHSIACVSQQGNAHKAVAEALASRTVAGVLETHLRVSILSLLS